MATITFYGAAGTVTGSKYLVETGRARVLVDAGLFQGPKVWRERNWGGSPFHSPSLDSIVLTHAHIDHTGYLPRVVAEGFDGPVYCSRATAELLRVLLPDSARLQEEEADYRNRKGLTRHKPAKPLYTEHDAQRALKLLRPVHRADQIEVARGIHATFYNAGHLLGARFVALDVETGDEGGVTDPDKSEIQNPKSKIQNRILFSGDIGRIMRPILWDPEPPTACDVLLVESTYGDRLHEETDPMEDLVRIIKDAAVNRRTVLIPAFAIGRTQELIYAIRELEDAGRVPIVPVRVDSPMASEAVRAFVRCVEDHDEEYKTRLAAQIQPLQTHEMRLLSSVGESRSINDERGPKIIIASSGMMTGGRVLHHALRVLPDPNGVIAFAGFQAEGTTGHRLLDGATEVKIMNQLTPVRCRVEKIAGISGHADWKGIQEWLAMMPGPGPRVTYCTHGEPAALEAHAAHIRERFGWRVEVPAYGETVEV